MGDQDFEIKKFPKDGGVWLYRILTFFQILFFGAFILMIVSGVEALTCFMESYVPWVVLALIPLLFVVAYLYYREFFWKVKKYKIVLLFVLLIIQILFGLGLISLSAWGSTC